MSAAQVDHRAKAAINFDGTHWLSDVLGKDVRTPLLVLTSEDPVTYSNEFFFEPLTTMGTREDIVRIKLQPEATHMELSDIMFLPAAARQALPGGGRVDGASSATRSIPSSARSSTTTSRAPPTATRSPC